VVIIIEYGCLKVKLMNILFIGLDYHNYTSSIVAEMRNLGMSVEYFDIQPRSIFFKSIRTVRRSVYDGFLKKHHEKFIAQSKFILYDKVIFLQAHQMSLENLALLRHVQRNAEFTLYNWDALTNHDYRLHAPFFDRVLTFDRRDAGEYEFGYLPLFCQRSMQGLCRDRADPGTLFMVGNIVKPQRYRAVEAFRAHCNANGLEFRQHLKISPVVWTQLFRSGIWPAGVSLRSIDSAAFRELIETSQGVFDFANHAQSGQTMRMMENLCAGKKIVTNNVWVKREPFYSPDRIHVFDGVDFSGVADFLCSPLAEPGADFSEYYIQSFTRQLLGLDELLSIKGAV
jgi:hypothetical protein